MNTTEKGKMFERIIEAIQKVLEPNDSIIHTNKKLNGKRGEIDILIIRKNNNEKYTIAIECKNYTTSIPVSVVDAFYGKCKRLSANYQIDERIIVAQKFQSGAIEAANLFNIKLCSLEKVQRDDILLKKIRFKYELKNLYLLDPHGPLLPIKKYAEYIPSKAYDTIKKQQIEFNKYIRQEGFKEHKSERDEETIFINFKYKTLKPIMIKWENNVTFYKTISGLAIVHFQTSPIQINDMHQYYLISHEKQGKALYVACENQMNVVYTKENYPIFITPEGKHQSYKMDNKENGSCLIVDI